MEIEGLKGKVIESVLVDGDLMAIHFTDSTRLVVESSEWLNIDNDEYREKIKRVYEENRRKREEAQDRFEAEIRKSYPGLI